MHQQSQKQKSVVSPAEVQRYLAGADYPCSKEQLIKAARSNGASEDVINLLRQLPDTNYNSPTDVYAQIGEIE